MQIGIVGKPNTGKSTFFSAATLVDVAIGSRPFVTIKPNQGIGFVSNECPHKEIGKQCNPKEGNCINGIRFIPITLTDVAGLVPDAWQGKGLGNQFLNDLMQAKALIHVLDASGSTDAEGNIVEAGSHDPAEDVIFLEREIAQWIKQILERNWQKISRQAASTKKPMQAIASQLSGLGITIKDVEIIFEKEKFSEDIQNWNDTNLIEFASSIVKYAKPILVAANKMDVEPAKQNLEKLRKKFPEKIFVPCFAEAELALRRAAKQQLIEYLPGSSEFKILKQLSPEQEKALEFIREKLQEFNGTGVQQALNKVAFELLKLIVVYPVEDALHWTDSKGNVLPDALLLNNGSTPLDLAEAIHSSFRERFIAAIDARTKQKLAKDYKLKMNDVVKIQLSR